MSVTTNSTDPVQTLIDILNGTAAGDWPNGTKPDPVEAQWESTLRLKMNRNGSAAYVWSPEVGTRDQLGAEYEDVIQTEAIAVDVWSIDEPEADNVSTDVVSILEDYATDTRDYTTWVTIRPTEVDDRRAEALARRTGHYVVSVRVELMRDDDTGT